MRKQIRPLSRAEQEHNRESRRLSRKKHVRLLEARIKSGLPIVIGHSNLSPSQKRVSRKIASFLNRIESLRGSAPFKSPEKMRRIMKQARNLDYEYFQATGFFTNPVIKRVNESLTRKPFKTK